MHQRFIFRPIGPKISNFFQKATTLSVTATPKMTVAEVSSSSNLSHKEPNEPQMPMHFRSPRNGKNVAEEQESYTTDEALDWDEKKASIPFSSLCALFQRIEVVLLMTSHVNKSLGDSNRFGLKKLPLFQDAIFYFFHQHDPLYLYRFGLGFSMNWRRCLALVAKKKHRPRASLSRSSVLFDGILNLKEKVNV